MHLELTQVLTCPFCGPEHGLIAFVDRMEERRIVAGRLDCPTCERRHAVRDGAVHVSAGDGGSRRRGAALEDAGPECRASGAPEAVLADLPEPAPTAAALLGPADGPETLLLAGGAGPLGPAIADLRPEAAVLTYGPLPAAMHPRVYPVVPEDPEADLPFRSESFDGVVLAADYCPELVSAIFHILRRGARLVVLGPRGDVATVDPAMPLRELAADERAWVGVRG